VISIILAAAIVAVYVHQDGVHRSQDGDRYTGGVMQPRPFHRRFLHWPPRLLMVVTWASFIALASLLGGWKSSLMFMTLPGVWFCVMHPTTVDGPSMLLAWLSALAWQHQQPYLAVLLSCVSGVIHERGPVFAALYAWHWLPIVGVAVPLLVGLRKPAEPDRKSADLAERLVGHGTLGAIKAHKPYVDLMGETGLVWSLRGLPLMAAFVGAGPSAWASLGVAFASRIIGTDTSRFLLWAAPPLCAAVGDVPWWMVALHVMTFRRAMQ
jgi:hypothetical protein